MIQKSEEKTTRRTVLKSIVSGTAAIAAYNLFPARWDKPIIESIFLPAHAATSGTSNPFVNNWVSNPTPHSVNFYEDGTAKHTIIVLDEPSNPTSTTVSGTYTVSGNTATFKGSDGKIVTFTLNAQGDQLTDDNGIVYNKLW